MVQALYEVCCHTHSRNVQIHSDHHHHVFSGKRVSVSFDESIQPHNLPHDHGGAGVQGDLSKVSVLGNAHVGRGEKATGIFPTNMTLSKIRDARIRPLSRLVHGICIYLSFFLYLSLCGEY